MAQNRLAGNHPGIPPIGLRYNQFFQVTSRNANNFNAQLPPGTVGTYIPTTDFQTGLFSIFTAGNFGDGIAFWVDDDISVSGANANGALGDAYLKFVNISRFFKLPPDLSLRVGQFELDLPFTQARTYNNDLQSVGAIGRDGTLSLAQNVKIGALREG